MANDAAVGKRQSLAELIGALDPGDPCPWCGGRLQGCTSVGRVAAVPAELCAAAVAEYKAVLVCGECGSEVCVAAGGSWTRSRGSLSAAA